MDTDIHRAFLSLVILWFCVVILFLPVKLAEKPLIFNFAYLSLPLFKVNALWVYLDVCLQEWSLNESNHLCSVREADWSMSGSFRFVPL